MNNDERKIGIAVTLCNGGKYILPQITSFLKQTRLADKVVFCDDNSSDNTLEILYEFIEENNLSDKWFVYKNNERLGYIKNFYKAIDLCDTDLIFLSDQDDVWELDKIEMMAKICECHPEIKMLNCKIRRFSEDCDLIKDANRNSTFNLEKHTISQVLKNTDYAGMSICFRKDLVLNIIDEIKEIKAPHDLTLSLLALDIDGYFGIDYIGTNYRIHFSNTSNNDSGLKFLFHISARLEDMKQHYFHLEEILNSKILLEHEVREFVSYRHELIKKRYIAIVEKSIKKLIICYRYDSKCQMRKFSFLYYLFVIMWLSFNTIFQL